MFGVGCLWEPGTKPSAAGGWPCARTRAAGAPVHGPRPLTPITGRLACALPRIKKNDEVDPSARWKMWAGNSKGLRVVGGVRGAGRGVTVCLHRYVSSLNSRTRQGFQVPATLLGRGALAVYDLE